MFQIIVQELRRINLLRAELWAGVLGHRYTDITRYLVLLVRHTDITRYLVLLVRHTNITRYLVWGPEGKYNAIMPLIARLGLKSEVLLGRCCKYYYYYYYIILLLLQLILFYLRSFFCRFQRIRINPWIYFLG